jgi:hypothetical protein
MLDRTTTTSDFPVTTAITGRDLLFRRRTNSKALMALFGDEPDARAGHCLTLYLGTYGKQGKPCIRLKSPGGNGVAKETTQTVASSPSAPFEEIPF